MLKLHQDQKDILNTTHEVEKLIDVCVTDILDIIHDEIYMDFKPEESYDCNLLRIDDTESIIEKSIIKLLKKYDKINKKS